MDEVKKFVHEDSKILATGTQNSCSDNERRIQTGL
jgi:hypothetical protein